MTTSFFVFSIYISSLLILFLQLTNGNPLSDVCLQTRQPPVCVGALGSDYRSKTAKSLPELAQITLQVADRDAADTKNKIIGLFFKPPKLTRALMQCRDLYTEIQQDVINADDQLKGRRFSEVYNSGLKIRNTVSRCEAALGFESPVKTENLNMAIVAEAISVIAKNLLL